MERYFQTLAIGANKRERTRGALLDSAVDVFARQGISSARISDITEQAGLANGTFYNHFKDKDELVAKTAVAIAVELGKRLDAAMAGIEDAVARVVVASSRFLSLALTYPEWGVVLDGAARQIPALRTDAVRYLRADIQRGLDQGKFDVTLDQFLLDQIATLMLASLRSQLDTGPDKRLIARTCEHILRLLGLTPGRARAAVDKARPLLEKLAA